jgi:hypothetical protein
MQVSNEQRITITDRKAEGRKKEGKQNILNGR